MAVRIGLRRQLTIDQYATAHREVQAVQPAMKRRDALRAEILSWTESEPAAAALILNGQQYQVQVTERALEATVDLAKVFRVLGAEKFFDAASVSVTSLKRLLDPEKFEQCVAYQRTGNRLVKPLALVVPVKAA